MVQQRPLATLCDAPIVTEIAHFIVRDTVARREECLDGPEEAATHCRDLVIAGIIVITSTLHRRYATFEASALIVLIAVAAAALAVAARGGFARGLAQGVRQQVLARDDPDDAVAAEDDDVAEAEGAEHAEHHGAVGLLRDGPRAAVKHHVEVDSDAVVPRQVGRRRGPVTLARAERAVRARGAAWAVDRPVLRAVPRAVRRGRNAVAFAARNALGRPVGVPRGRALHEEEGHLVLQPVVVAHGREVDHPRLAPLLRVALPLLLLHYVGLEAREGEQDLHVLARRGADEAPAVDDGEDVVAGLQRVDDVGDAVALPQAHGTLGAHVAGGEQLEVDTGVVREVRHEVEGHQLVVQRFAQRVGDALARDDGDHDGQQVVQLTRELDHDDAERHRHAAHAAEEGARADEGEDAWVHPRLVRDVALDRGAVGVVHRVREEMHERHAVDAADGGADDDHRDDHAGGDGGAADVPREGEVEGEEDEERRQRELVHRAAAEQAPDRALADALHRKRRERVVFPVLGAQVRGEVRPVLRVPRLHRRVVVLAAVGHQRHIGLGHRREAVDRGDALRRVRQREAEEGEDEDDDERLEDAPEAVRLDRRPAPAHDGEVALGEDGGEEAREDAEGGGRDDARDVERRVPGVLDLEHDPHFVADEAAPVLLGLRRVDEGDDGEAQHRAEEELPGRREVPKRADLLHDEEQAADGGTERGRDAARGARGDEVALVFVVSELAEEARLAPERAAAPLRDARADDGAEVNQRRLGADRQSAGDGADAAEGLADEGAQAHDLGHRDAVEVRHHLRDARPARGRLEEDDDGRGEDDEDSAGSEPEGQAGKIAGGALAGVLDAVLEGLDAEVLQAGDGAQHGEGDDAD
eukprot:CAMPEP_0174844770 /NCGR_PEP_ID=MMETSP1114-20130205/11294_1 /TAXON_ID=312471 /ORGANISM="Neobodo designis, Strain CCAP 1951/1" /LENGTH=868 /DNA_ID=CAMNT_0016079015 /DNA_START=17 /DNA_END=2620 /DNA_ORIENTATION=+